MAIVPIEKLVYAVGEVETGHIPRMADRYKIVNSIGAHGRYQVMRGNIPSWTKEALGRTYTPAEFLASPKAQDKVATFRLARDMKKYGSWESAAAVWFSGQPNPNSGASDGANTVRQYIAKARAAMGKGSVSADGSAGAGSGSTAPAGLIDDALGGLGAGAARIGDALASIGKSMLSVGDLATLVLKLALPSTWVRIAAGVLGLGLLLFGLVLLGNEAKGT